MCTTSRFQAELMCMCVSVCLSMCGCVLGCERATRDQGEVTLFGKAARCRPKMGLDTPSWSVSHVLSTGTCSEDGETDGGWRWIGTTSSPMLLVCRCMAADFVGVGVGAEDATGFLPSRTGKRIKPARGYVRASSSQSTNATTDLARDQQSCAYRLQSRQRWRQICGGVIPCRSLFFPRLHLERPAKHIQGQPCEPP